jgi:hypothetical protein
MIACGDTFLIGDDEDPENFHLWVVATPPSGGEVVTVCVTTRRAKSETLVVLKAGDHPFIQHESVIAYSYSRIREVDEIEAAIANKTAKKREPVTDALLKRVQSGLLDSDFTPNGVRYFLKGVLGIS